MCFLIKVGRWICVKDNVINKRQYRYKLINGMRNWRKKANGLLLDKVSDGFLSVSL